MDDASKIKWQMLLMPQPCRFESCLASLFGVSVSLLDWGLQVSSSTNVVGVRDLDGKFTQMIAAKHACEAAGVELPESVRKYFGRYASESEELLRREMQELSIDHCVTTNQDESMTDCWEVDLRSLPPEVKAIRFKNSY